MVIHYVTHIYIFLKCFWGRCDLLSITIIIIIIMFSIPHHLVPQFLGRGPHEREPVPLCLSFISHQKDHRLVEKKGVLMDEARYYGTAYLCAIWKPCNTSSFSLSFLQPAIQHIMILLSLSPTLHSLCCKWHFFFLHPSTHTHTIFFAGLYEICFLKMTLYRVGAWLRISSSRVTRWLWTPSLSLYQSFSLVRHLHPSPFLHPKIIIIIISIVCDCLRMSLKRAPNFSPPHSLALPSCSQSILKRSSKIIWPPLLNSSPSLWSIASSSRLTWWA